MTHTHNDNPQTDCGLGREEWRKRVLDQIVHAQAPKVIGIHGTWGTGKTSLLAQLYLDMGGRHAFSPTKEVIAQKEKDFKARYKDNPKTVQPIWFEAWQYQHEPNILAALLKEIRDQLSLGYKLVNRVKEDTLITTTSLLQSISFKFSAFGAEFGSNIAENTSNNLKQVQKERMAEPMDAVLHKKMLKEAIDQLLNLDLLVYRRQATDGRKAVIFIDDLDRCQPDVAFRILESIKVYLSLENCVFVLGMDMEAVEGILARYHEQHSGENSAESQARLKNLSRLYLEKICQDVYHLPLPSQEEKTAYFKSLLDGRFGKGSLLEAELAALAEDFDILPPFPRSIKIYANVIISHFAKSEIRTFIQGNVGDADEKPARLKSFLIITYLYAFHYEVYQLVYLYPDFYNSVFIKYAKDPFTYSKEAGKHPELSNLTVRIDPDNLAEVSSGKTPEESRTILDNAYPNRNFRRVLWIRKLVKDADNIHDPYLKCLKL